MLLGVCLQGPRRRLRWRMTLAAATALAAVVGAGWFPVSSAGAATLTVNTSSLPAARQASAYSATLGAAGGTAPYHWSVSGSLPAGLSLSTAGVITGVPTAAGTTNVTLKVTDSGTPTAASATRTLRLTVLARLNQSIVYVLSGENSAVTEYAPGASGDVAPTAMIYGPKTELGFAAFGLAVSPARRVYVAGSTQNGTSAVFEFAPGATGNVAPQTVISGSATGLDHDAGVALDKAGDIWVANGGNGTITEYAPTASGNVAPRLTLGGAATGLMAPFRLTFDAAGNLWVTNPQVQNPTVTEYAAASLRQTSSQPVNLAPIATLASTKVPAPLGIVFDPLGGFHVADEQAGAVVGFPPGSPNGNPAPSQDITGGNTQLQSPTGLTADPAGRLYVAAGYVVEFNYNSNGNVSPVALIGGPATQLDGAIDVAVSRPAPLAYAGATLLRPTTGGQYSYTLTARGGIAPYHFRVSSGTLPAGLSLASNGVLHGVPQSAGTSTVTIKIADSAQPAASTTKTVQLTVGAPPPLKVSTSTLPPTAVGQNYAATLTATGGVGSYTWAVSAGALPGDLALSPDGKITGTPSFSGAFTFTVTVTDSAAPTNHTASRTLTVTVKVQPGVYAASAGNDSVTEYPLGQGGDIPPIADIVGPHTGLSSPESVVLDAAGDAFVANEGNNTVTEYAPGDTGDASPIMTITGVSQPARLALNGSGDLYVASLANSISEYSVASGASKLIATITGQDQPRGLAVDANSNLWVSESSANAVKEYSPTASGAATPIASISGADTGLTSPQGLVFDSSGNLTVANAGTNGSDGTVTVYSAGQLTGDSVPVQTFSSGLSEPLGVDRGTDQTLFVADVGDNAIAEYAPGATTPSEVISGPIFTHLSVPVGVAATPPLSILTKSLPAAHRRRRYLVNLKAAEGTTPYRWTISRGRLPRGLSLTRKGAIIGIPHSRRGVYRFTVRVRDRTHPAQVVTRRLRLRLKRHARSRGVRASHHRHR